MNGGIHDEIDEAKKKIAAIIKWQNLDTMEKIRSQCSL